MNNTVVKWVIGLGLLGVVALAVYRKVIVKPVDRRSEETPFPSDPATEQPIDISVPLAAGDIDRAD